MKRDLENFRLLVFLSITSLVIATGISFLPMPLSAAQIALLEASGEGALLPGNLSFWLYWSSILIWFLAFVLAFFYVWFSRYLFIIYFVATIVLAATDGVVALEPWSSTLWMIHWAFATFAIGMLFFSPAVRAKTDGNLSEFLDEEPFSGPEHQMVVPPGGF
ncbi:MAG: hypothetical protein R3F22_02575 [Lysobacteraceae bacterium]